ncbi:glycoside hydrolase family 108 protein [Ancylobacter polymorphus]|uniref:Lysozyme family protein n=1 Tax=Ancylobacter polymorphus TaxID=223390 RepID=A0ABU0BHQ0_9HYPH|nr:glycoside hydrolase family 108 protein [Ancylobacter polymorphus]MDQ0305355.1 lysozyme family protein [Ancylobacter polymorphus]
MTAAGFARAQPHVLAYEGKFSNHPDDPGGRTYEGITQRVYDAWCAANGQPKRTLSKDTGKWAGWTEQRDAIYRKQYWDAVRGDELPAGVDFAVYDAAVNSGPGRAIRWLQRALRLNRIDGVFGVATLAAVKAHPDKDLLVAAICAERLTFLQALGTWKTFGKGWGRRVAAVKATGQAWATGSVGPAPDKIDDASAKAVIESAPPAPSTAGADAAIGAGSGTATVGTVIESVRQQIEPYAGASERVQQIVVALIVLGALVTFGGLAWRWYTKRKAARLAEALA